MKRLGGKPPVVNQVYLGTAHRILSVFTEKKQALPRRISSRESGSVSALWEIEKGLGTPTRTAGPLPSFPKGATIRKGDTT
jgi:hypothetical protein